MFQKMPQIIFESIPVRKTVSEVQKIGILHFGSQADERGEAILSKDWPKMLTAN